MNVATYATNPLTGVATGLQGPTGPWKGWRNTRKSNIGTRIFGGRMGAFDNTTTQTFQVTCSLAQHFDAVRVIFANGSNAGTIAVGGCKISSQSAASDLNNSAGSWNSVYMAGSLTGTIPAAATAASRRGYLVSDWVALNSADRSDGGTFPLITIRASITTAASISIFGNGTDDYTNWPTRPNGRIWCMRNQSGDQITTPSGFTSTTNAKQSPVIGVQYAARGQVITVMGAGDSITEGHGGTYLGEGFGVPACESLSSMSGTAVEWCNIGISGSGANIFRDQVIDILAAGIKPDLLVLSYGSPNDNGGTWLAATTTGIRGYLGQMFGTVRENQVPVVLWTVMPTNPSVKAYGATDALRVAHNTATLAMASKGMDVMDFSAALSGITDGTGQVNMLAGSTTDGIHPNDAGNAILAPILAAKIKEYFC